MTLIRELCIILEKVHKKVTEKVRETLKNSTVQDICTSLNSTFFFCKNK